MHFGASPEQTELRELARKFVEKEILPIVENDEEEGRFRPELIARLGELGLTAIPLPEAHGGAGLGYAEYITLIEELARGSTAYAISVAVTGLTQMILNQYGTEAQKKKYIPALASGQAIGSFCLSEASSGSDAGSLRTTAKKDGNDYVINGTKLWITQANVASTFIVMARTGAEGAKGISAFIVDKTMSGVRPSKRERKMGWLSSPTMELVLENVRVPAENLLGKEGDGFKIAMQALDSGRITIAASSLGLAQGALDVATRHACEREQFGKAIIEFQGVGFMLADMKMSLEAARLMVEKAAWLHDQGLPYGVEAAMAKVVATDAAMRITTDAVQVMGGSGYTKDFPVERYMRDAKVMQIVEGTNQIQRVVIARSMSKAHT